MRILRFRHHSSQAVQYGTIRENEETVTVVESPFALRESTGKQCSLSEVTLLPPIEPPNILAIGLNYQRHAKETGASLPQLPVLFIKATSALAGPEDAIRIPRIAPDEVDFEAELAIVIGRTIRNVPENEALDAVLGYTCSNDVSARDCQRMRGKQWARAKSFDTFCPMGPWIETDLDPDALTIKSRLNGEIMQSSNTSDQIFNCRRLISFLSQGMTLYPGTVIMTGTPEGVGMARTPPVFLKAGDTIEVEIEGIGTLQNSVTTE